VGDGLKSFVELFPRGVPFYIFETSLGGNISQRQFEKGNKNEKQKCQRKRKTRIDIYIKKSKVDVYERAKVKAKKEKEGVIIYIFWEGEKSYMESGGGRYGFLTGIYPPPPPPPSSR
jgi:hypothetical protein